MIRGIIRNDIKPFDKKRSYAIILTQLPLFSGFKILYRSHEKARVKNSILKTKAITVL
jgi:hypothetical protein